MRTGAGMVCVCLLAVAGVAYAGEDYQNIQFVGTPSMPVHTVPDGETLEPQRIVVTATRIPTPVEQVSDSVSVYTIGTPGTGSGEQPVAISGSNFPATMESRQIYTVMDVLKDTPGVSVQQGGGFGGLTDVRIRGMDSGRTKVLLGGMPLNDPSSIDGTYDFGGLMLDNVDQFEVLRGPQSSLYGSNASGGVINMTMKKGEGPLNGFVFTEGGSRGTVLSRLGVAAASDKADFSLGGSVYHTDGFSFAERSDGNTEKDAFDQGNIALRLGANPFDTLRLDLYANAQKSKKELDYDSYRDFWFGGPDILGDNPYYKQETERYMIRPEATLSLFDGMWDQKVGFGYASTERKYKDRDHATNWGTPLRTRYKGETIKFDYESILRLHDYNILVAGVDVINESMEFQRVYYGPGRTPTQKPDSVTTVGVYLEDQIHLGESFLATVGGRYEHHEEFGDKLTWKASAAYSFPTGTKVKASAGTGFQAPSLYELYVGTYTPGWSPVRENPDLDPETTFGWETGLEQSLFCDRLMFGSTFFWNKVKNKISDVLVDPSNPYGDRQYRNVDLYRTWGIESFINFRLTDTVVLSANHTWLRTDTDDTTARTMWRRPLNEASVNADWSFCESRGTLTVGMKYVGRRLESYKWDVDSANPRPKMPSYTTVRVGAAWQVNDRFRVHARVENLFNKKYQEIYGCGTERISFYAGATLSF